MCVINSLINRILPGHRVIGDGQIHGLETFDLIAQAGGLFRELRRAYTPQECDVGCVTLLWREHNKSPMEVVAEIPVTLYGTEDEFDIQQSAIAELSESGRLAVRKEVLDQRIRRLLG